MGHKNVCLNCRRVESLGTDFNNFRTGNCPECKSEMIFINHKFRPPKKSDDKSWKIVEKLVRSGYKFRHLYYNEGKAVKYPTTIKECDEFILKYLRKAE